MGGAIGAGGAGTDGGTITVPWDWSGVVGTGQSLSVGDPGNASGTASAAVRATTQPFQNLKLSTGTAAFPVDPNDPNLAMLPLTEPVGRRSTAFPSAWPTNIAGETYHSAMGNQIAQLVQAAGLPYVSVHGEVGENGQCLTFLVKGATAAATTGHSYEAALTETRAITRLAQAAGQSYGVGAIVVTHGECDAGNTNYEAELRQLWADYSVDLPAITGQTRLPIMIVSQQDSVNDGSAATQAQWRIGVDFPNDIVCSGPKYQYAYAPDAIHLLVDGYEALGEKYGQVYVERVLRGSLWQPLQPTTATRNGRIITVTFQVPVPPLAWEETFQMPHQPGVTEWSAGRGFEVRSGATPLAIASVEIVGDTVQITTGVDLPLNGVTVGYAMTASSGPMQTPFAGTTRWGQLRDSDPFVGGMTGTAQPNFAVAFVMAVP